jgi:hypothetical protein
MDWFRWWFLTLVTPSVSQSAAFQVAFGVSVWLVVTMNSWNIYRVIRFSYHQLLHRHRYLHPMHGAIWTSCVQLTPQKYTCGIPSCTVGVYLQLVMNSCHTD